MRAEIRIACHIDDKQITNKAASSPWTHGPIYIHTCLVCLSKKPSILPFNSNGEARSAPRPPRLPHRMSDRPSSLEIGYLPTEFPVELTFFASRLAWQPSIGRLKPSSRKPFFVLQETAVSPSLVTSLASKIPILCFCASSAS